MELDSLKHDNENVKATAGDYNRLQNAVAELEEQLQDAQQKFAEQTSLVCVLLCYINSTQFVIGL